MPSWDREQSAENSSASIKQDFTSFKVNCCAFDQREKSVFANNKINISWICLRLRVIPVSAAWNFNAYDTEPQIIICIELNEEKRQVDQSFSCYVPTINKRLYKRISTFVKKERIDESRTIHHQSHRRYASADCWTDCTPR